MRLTRRGRIVRAIAIALLWVISLWVLVQLTPPPAHGSTAAYCKAANGLPGYYDNGSGCLDPYWTTRAHGSYGKLDGPDVMLVGDSITTQTKSYIATKIQAAGLTYGVNYWSSRPTKPAVDWVLALQKKPKVLLMMTGTNDIYNTPVMAAQIKRLVDGLKPYGTKILWVDVWSSKSAANLKHSVEVNKQIWAASGITPVKWFGLLNANAYRQSTYLDAGKTHVTISAGANFRAAAVAPFAIQAAK